MDVSIFIHTELSINLIGLTEIHFNAFNFPSIASFFILKCLLFQNVIAPVKFCSDHFSVYKINTVEKGSVDRVRLSNHLFKWKGYGYSLVCSICSAINVVFFKVLWVKWQMDVSLVIASLNWDQHTNHNTRQSLYTNWEGIIMRDALSSAVV